MIEEYQAERIFVETGRKTETSLVLRKAVLQRETAVFKSRSSSSTEAFYVLTLNGYGIGWRGFLYLYVDKVTSQISGSLRRKSKVDLRYFLGL